MQAHLGIVGDEEGEAAGGKDQVMKGGHGYGEAIMRGGPTPQLVYDHQGPGRGFAQDVAGFRQFLHH